MTHHVLPQTIEPIVLAERMLANRTIVCTSALLLLLFWVDVLNT